MSVVCQCFSVIVPNEVIEQKFPGGVAGYEASCPNQTYCSDGLLTRVGFMAPEDFKFYVLELSKHDIRAIDSYEGTDVIVIDQFKGPVWRCGWIRFAVEENLARAWMAGTEPGELAKPKEFIDAKIARIDPPGPEGTRIVHTPGWNPLEAKSLYSTDTYSEQQIAEELDRWGRG